MPLVRLMRILRNTYTDRYNGLLCQCYEITFTFTKVYPFPTYLRSSTFQRYAAVIWEV